MRLDSENYFKTSGLEGNRFATTVTTEWCYHEDGFSKRKTAAEDRTTVTLSLSRQCTSIDQVEAVNLEKGSFRQKA